MKASLGLLFLALVVPKCSVTPQEKDLKKEINQIHSEIKEKTEIVNGIKEDGPLIVESDTQPITESGVDSEQEARARFEHDEQKQVNELWVAYFEGCVDHTEAATDEEVKSIDQTCNDKANAAYPDAKGVVKPNTVVDEDQE